MVRPRRWLSGLRRQGGAELSSLENVEDDHPPADSPTDPPADQPAGRPTVSIVLPVYNVQPWLEECLESLISQTFSDFEVVVVDDGSTDGSRSIIDNYAGRDPRFRVFAQANTGLGAARNMGVERAVGEFLTFVDSDDALPPRALERLVDAARLDDAELVTGGVLRYDGSETKSMAWVGQVHGLRRGPMRAIEFLPILRNLYTWNKLYRRSFWDRCGWRFREGVSYEDQPIVTQLLLAAERVTVITDVVYLYRVRPDRSSISQQVGSVKDLRDRLAAWDATREALRDYPQEVYDAWVRTLLSTHLHWYFSRLDEVSDEYWTLLQHSVADIAGSATSEDWRLTPPPRRVAVELVRQGRRDDVVRFNDAGGRNQHRWPTRRVCEGLLIELPFVDDPRLPEHLFMAHPEQLEVAHRVEGMRWVDGGVELTGVAYLAQTDPAGQEIEILLLDPNSPDEPQVVVLAERGPDPVSSLPYEDGVFDYQPVGFRAVLPVDCLMADADPRTSWQLHIRVTNDGLVASAPISEVLASGSAGRLPASGRAEGALMELATRRGLPLALEYKKPRLQVTDVALRGRSLSGRLLGPALARVSEVALAVDEKSRGTQRGGPAVQGAIDSDGCWSVEVPAHNAGNDGADGADGALSWRLRAVRRNGELMGLSILDPHWVNHGPSDSANLMLRRTRTGGLAIETSPSGAWIDSVTTDQRGIEVLGRAWGALNSLRLDLDHHHGGSIDIEADGAGVTSEPFQFTLRHDLQDGSRSLPVGEFEMRLIAQTPAGELSLPIKVDDAVASQMPLGIASNTAEGWVTGATSGPIRLRLRRPLGRFGSRFAQAQLRDASYGQLVDGLLLRSDRGRSASGDVAALFNLVRLGERDLPVWWGTLDYSVAVPQGAQGVLIGSPRWYELLATARWVADDSHWPRRPEVLGQALLELDDPEAENVQQFAERILRSRR